LFHRSSKLHASFATRNYVAVIIAYSFSKREKVHNYIKDLQLSKLWRVSNETESFMKRFCDDRVTAQRMQRFMCYVMIDTASNGRGVEKITSTASSSYIAKYRFSHLCEHYYVLKNIIIYC